MHPFWLQSVKQITFRRRGAADLRAGGPSRSIFQRFLPGLLKVWDDTAKPHLRYPVGFGV
jgi:hypothetical protein